MAYYPSSVEKRINLQNVTSSDISTIVSNNVTSVISQMRDAGVEKAKVAIITDVPPEEAYQLYWEEQFEWLVKPSDMTDTNLSNLESEVVAVLTGMKERHVRECTLMIYTL